MRIIDMCSQDAGVDVVLFRKDEQQGQKTVLSSRNVVEEVQ